MKIVKNKIMKLNKFLVKAKKNTYASNGEGGEKKLEDGTKELTYIEGEYKYRDRYFGNRAFIGQEIVWQNGKAVWGMNYYGRMLSDSIDMEKLYSFLKKALLKVNELKPFRGPEILDEGDFLYGSSTYGSLKDFHGEEGIFYLNHKVYRLWYHGGIIEN